MKVRVTIPDVAGRSIDETISGADADDILSQAKTRVMRELGFKGLFLRAITPLAFAQGAVSRYNSAYGTSYAIPPSAGEFFRLGQDLGYITLLPDD